MCVWLGPPFSIENGNTSMCMCRGDFFWCLGSTTDYLFCWSGCSFLHYIVLYTVMYSMKEKHQNAEMRGSVARKSSWPLHRSIFQGLLLYWLNFVPVTRTGNIPSHYRKKNRMSSIQTSFYSSSGPPEELSRHKFDLGEYDRMCSCHKVTKLPGCIVTNRRTSASSDRCVALSNIMLCGVTTLRKVK